MKKRVVDLTPEELDEYASTAWSTAAQDALARGFSVLGSRDGRLLRYFPDGTVEDLGPVTCRPDESGAGLARHDAHLEDMTKDPGAGAAGRRQIFGR